MKRRQRVAHLLIWLLLAPVLGGVIFAALAVRPADSPLSGYVAGEG